MFSYARAWFTLLATVTVAGCGTAGTSVAPILPRPGVSGAPVRGASPTPAPSASAVPTATATPSANGCRTAPPSAIYVADAGNNSITVYPGNPSGTLNEAPLATIAGSNTGLNVPVAIALDASGKIYVANYGSGSAAGSITVYAANPCGTLNEAPLATIAGSSTGFVGLVGIAVDGSGKIFVTNQVTGTIGSGTGTIEDFPANPSGTLNEAPLSSFSLPAPEDVALDTGGNVYVVISQSTNNSIVVFAGNPSGTLTQGPFATIAGSNTGLFGNAGIAVDASGRIYVVNPVFSSNSPQSVRVYAPITNGGGNEAPLATIAGSNTGLSGPNGVAIDASGKIDVVNFAAFSVTVYGANPSGTINENPFATIAGSNTALNQPQGIAVRPPSAVVGAPGATPTPSPTPTATAPGATPTPTATAGPTATPTPTAPPAGPAMYIAQSGNNSITVTSLSSGGGNVAPFATIVGSNTGLSQPGGVAVDASGNIYVANPDANGSGPPPSLTVYPAVPAPTLANPSATYNQTPLATISGSNTGMSFGEPSAVAVDASGKVYVANQTGGGSLVGSVTVYAANPSGTLNETPLATIGGGATGLSYPVGITVDPSGKIYVANASLAGSSGGPSSITVYPPITNGGGDEAPLATITGNNTGIVGAYGVALDASGKIYVTSGNLSVDVFAANPSGTLNETPLATIAGNNTGLTNPIGGVALDASGNIYVVNTGYPKITVYAANPSGTLNEAPIEAVFGSDTRLSNPIGITIH